MNKIKLIVFATIVVAVIVLAFNYHKNNTTEWFAHVQNKTKQQPTGQFFTTDKAGVPIILDWEKIAANTPAFKQKMANLADIIAQAHTRPVVQLMQQKPEVIHNVSTFAPLEPYFARVKENIDWNFVEEKIRIVTAAHPDIVGSQETPDDVCWFVIAREHTDEKPLGFVQILLSPAYTDGTIKVKKLMIYPHAQHRGLGKVLISSIFNIIPDVKRIILNVLCTNNQAIQAYKSYGFKQYEQAGKIPDPTNMSAYELHLQYLTSESEKLQKIAEHLTLKQ